MNEANQSVGGVHEPPRAILRLAIIGAFLTGVNTVVSTLALGVFQGFIVSFTTPFAFCLGRLLYPRLPAATIIYVPVIIVSLFTLNFGPPGHHKLLFIVGSLLYDLVAYVLGVHRASGEKVSLWKLIIANLVYPIGLLLAAFLIISFLTVELPLLSKGWIGALAMLIFFGVMGSFATFVCHRAFYRWLEPLPEEETKDEGKT